MYIVSSNSTGRERESDIPVVEDKVDSGELLKSLKSDTSPSTKSVSSRSRTETVDVGGRTDRTFVVQVGGNLGELLVDLLRVGVVSENSSEGSSSLFISTFHE